MRDLFEPLTRDERQQECIQNWVKNKCKAVIEAATGFGKTRCALKAIELVRKKYPNFRILVVVPTETLRQQWVEELTKWNFIFNTDVQIINTVIKHNWECDFLILDECHRMAASGFAQVFTKVKYKAILGLTATLERLDDRHKIIEKYCPICDSVTLADALANGWVSDYVEYKVMLDVPDIDVYKDLNKEFTKHFEFFNFDFNKAMEMVGKDAYKKRIAYRDELCPKGTKEEKSNVLKAIMYHATSLMRVMQERKKFINNHPEKIRLTREIMKHRPDAKIVTFSATVDVAEKIGDGYVYSGRDSKKKGRMTLEEFSNVESGVLHTVKKADEGMDVKGLSVAIILGQDSSSTRSVQRKGRVIRKEGNKVAEVFTFVINDTVECSWFEKSHAKDNNYITIGEEGLMQVLRREQPDTYKKPVSKFTFRF